MAVECQEVLVLASLFVLEVRVVAACLDAICPSTMIKHLILFFHRIKEYPELEGRKQSFPRSASEQQCFPVTAMIIRVDRTTGEMGVVPIVLFE